MLLKLWLLPMAIWGWLLTRLSGCTRDALGFYYAPEKSLLNRWMNHYGFVGITCSYYHIIFKFGYEPPLEVINHELAHVEQQIRHGPFHPLVYWWCSLVSWFKGTGWYHGNALEVEAREKASLVQEAP